MTGHVAYFLVVSAFVRLAFAPSSEPGAAPVSVPESDYGDKTAVVPPDAEKRLQMGGAYAAAGAYVDVAIVVGIDVDAVVVVAVAVAVAAVAAVTDAVGVAAGISAVAVAVAVVTAFDTAVAAEIVADAPVFVLAVAAHRPG